MDPFTMAATLLGDIKLTPGQLAQLRAINTKYFTELFALQQKAATERGAGAAGESLVDRPPIPEAELTALDAVIGRDIRDILSDDQRAVLDRNWPRLRERAIERPVTDERARSASTGDPPPAAAPKPRTRPARRPEP